MRLPGFLVASLLASAAVQGPAQNATTQVPYAANLSEWGSARCPCANESAVANWTVGKPAGYGVGCHAHDLSVEDDCKVATSSQPPWCQQSWCFVTDDCSLQTDVKANIPELDLSYSTCGYLSARESTYISSSLIGVTVKVMVLSNTGGWRGSYCSAPGDCWGPTYTFWMQVLRAAGAKVVIVNTVTTSPWSAPDLPYPPEVLHQFKMGYPTSKSMFTSCVYATGMGFVDLCIGAFTLSPDRRQISMTVETDSTLMYLVAFQTSSPPVDFMTNVVTVFSVFEANLWVVIIACIAAMSMLILYHERVSYDGRESEVFEGLTWWEALETSMYRGFLTFLGGTDSVCNPTNRRSRTVAMGMSLFILLTIACYTANLASFLVTSNIPVASVSDLNSAINAGMSICVVDSDANGLIANSNIPKDTLAAALVRLLGKNDVLKAIFAGDCEAAVMEEEMYQQAASWDGGCNLMKVGDPLFTVFSGAPVSERAFRAMDFHVNNNNIKGDWRRELASAMPDGNCGAAQISGDNANVMTLESYLGPVFLAGLFCLASFGMQFCNVLHHHVTTKPERLPARLRDLVLKAERLRQQRSDVVKQVSGDSLGRPGKEATAPPAGHHDVQVLEQDEYLVIRVPRNNGGGKQEVAPMWASLTPQPLPGSTVEQFGKPSEVP